MAVLYASGPIPMSYDECLRTWTAQRWFCLTASSVRCLRVIGSRFAMLRAAQLGDVLHQLGCKGSWFLYP